MNRLAFIGVLCAIAACTPSIKPIDYGSEKCSHCRMSIVDQRFGCQLVTDKGKVHSFDAVECMIHYLHEQPDDAAAPAILATNTLDKPGDLSDASIKFYLVSENMPSPMGAYINPFTEKSAALENQQKNGGEIYSWDQLKEQFSDQ